jgi:DNA-binding transcriptional LysR family regulator
LRGLSSVPVADDEYCVVTPSAWSPQPSSIRDLAARPWVAGPPDTACGRALDRISTQYGFTAQRAHTCLEFPTVLALVAAGFGAAIVPKLVLAGAPPEAITLAPVPVAGHRRITVLRRDLPSGPEPLTQAMVEALQATAVTLGLTPVTFNS